MDPKPNPIKRLLGSSKALVVATALVLCFVGVYLGKLTWGQVEQFMTVTIPAWLLAVGLEDGAKHFARGRNASVTNIAPPAAEKSGA
jgi:hypothetical protein